jgi:hypothetical protein
MEDLTKKIQTKISNSGKIFCSIDGRLLFGISVLLLRRVDINSKNTYAFLVR